CLKYSKAPIVATHSSARALYDHARNLTDQMIIDLAAKGGVVQMNMLGSYLKSMDPNRRQALTELRQKYTGDLSPAQQAARDKEMQEINKKFPDDPATLQIVMD